MTESPELTTRQGLLLKLIVREHVESTVPVASRTLVDKYRLDFSPATVRNEMAALEELGYLAQPHTSAGRVPTEAGFRYFVARLMEEQSLPVPEQRRIAHQFHQARDHIEAWLPLAASVLARSSGVASVVTAPRTMEPVYKHLELVLTHGRAVLLILVLQGGTIEQQMLALSEPLTQVTLRDVADRLNQIFAGLRVAAIEARLGELPTLEADIARLVVSIMHNVEGTPSDEIYQHGLSDLLQEPEFTEGDAASTSVVRVLEERSLLQAVLAETLTPAVGIGSVRVLIGGEGRWDELRACGVVLARYGVMNYATGALGVVGPIRMPYGRTISVVRFVANILGELVYETYQPGIRGAFADNEWDHE